MLEGALRARVVAASTLVGQLDRLLAVIGLPTLEFGIIPFEAAAPWVYRLITVQARVAQGRPRSPELARTGNTGARDR